MTPKSPLNERQGTHENGRYRLDRSPATARRLRTMGTDRVHADRGFVARGHQVTPFATGDSTTSAYVRGFDIHDIHCVLAATPMVTPINGSSSAKIRPIFPRLR